MSAQHLRPLLAFVAVAIAGAVVFANALRAQDVVDAIRESASEVLAGTPLLHDPLYVVEEGARFDPVQDPETGPPTGAGSRPVGPDTGEASGADDAAPISTSAADGATGPPATGQGGIGGRPPGKSAPDNSPGPPRTATTSSGHGPAQGAASSSGPGPAGGHASRGHGSGDARARSGDRTVRAGEDHDQARARAHDRDGRDEAGGNDGEDRGGARGHAKPGHGEAQGTVRSKDHGGR